MNLTPRSPLRHGAVLSSWSAWGRVVIIASATAAGAYNVAVSVSSATWLPICTAGLCGAALLNKRWWPLAAMGCVLATGVWGWPMLYLLVIALYDAAVAGRIVVAAAMCALALVGNVLVRPVTPLWTVQPYGATLFAALAVMIGLWTRSRRRLITALQAQVDHLRTERELREQAARIAERSIIAAEMHDVLAHRLSLIALHAGVLAATAHNLPVPVIERLALLRAAAADALTDLRDVLTALHQPDASGMTIPAAPAERAVHDVLTEAQLAGQRIRGAVSAMPAGLSTAHRLAVLRVVQESLTNARKHAPDTEVDVTVDYGSDETTIDIVNPLLDALRAEFSPPAGFGLTGLAERVQALGGQFRAGVDGAGRFTVTAAIPHHPHRIGGDR